MSAARLAIAFLILAPSAFAMTEGVRFRILRQALEEAERPSGYWAPSQRDCAGFVRYLYHSAIAGPRPLWRDRAGQPVSYLKADELVAYNFDRIGRTVERARVRTGDVLAFYSPHKKPDERWHLMVLLEPPVAAPDRLLAVYHNGDHGRSAQVRKVWVDELLTESSPQWRPRPENPRFLGVFRWRGWKELKEQR